MTEESIPDFPQPNHYGLIYVDIDSELQKARITLQRIDIDFLNNTCTVTTDMEVPEDIMPRIRVFTEGKGITIKFLTSG